MAARHYIVAGSIGIREQVLALDIKAAYTCPPSVRDCDAAGAARYSRATASSPGRQRSPGRRVVCRAPARNRLRARRNQVVRDGPACQGDRVYRADQACPDDQACPANRVCRADPVCPDDRACRGATAYRGAMVCPVAMACRVCGRGRANDGRAKVGHGNRPCRRMR